MMFKVQLASLAVLLAAVFVDASALKDGLDNAAAAAATPTTAEQPSTTEAQATQAQGAPGATIISALETPTHSDHWMYDGRFPSNVGAACGRAVGLLDCGHGLVCVINPEVPTVPGVCVPPGIQFTGRNSRCHEWAPITTRCLPGLTCVPFEPLRGDGPGRCEFVTI
ncbi:hypothetical protein BDF22DRAFT_661760 [Syncephalis plumigaleata]|nr:hypothetical protein BDF22DRAFT_661760 [Syncephalis plumigaleata]